MNALSVLGPLGDYRVEDDDDDDPVLLRTDGQPVDIFITDAPALIDPRLRRAPCGYRRVIAMIATSAPSICAVAPAIVA